MHNRLADVPHGLVPVGCVCVSGVVLRMWADETMAVAVRRWLPRLSDSRQAASERDQPEWTVLLRDAEPPLLEVRGAHEVAHPHGRVLLRDGTLTFVADGHAARAQLDTRTLTVWSGAASAADPAAAAWTGLLRALRPTLHWALARSGLHPLHAGAVNWHGSGVVVLGRSGAGKSTLVTRLGRLGAVVLSDDVIYLREPDARCFAMGEVARLRSPTGQVPGPDPDGRTSVPLATPEARGTSVARMLVVGHPDDGGGQVRDLAVPELVRLLRRSALSAFDRALHPGLFATHAYLAATTPATLVPRGSRPPTDDELERWVHG